MRDPTQITLWEVSAVCYHLQWLHDGHMTIHSKPHTPQVQVDHLVGDPFLGFAQQALSTSIVLSGRTGKGVRVKLVASLT